MGGDGPTPEAFAEHYRRLFAANDPTPNEPFARACKPVTAVDDVEAQALSVPAITEMLIRSRWKKSIGPDNLPTDIFKCCPEESAVALSAIFRVLWATKQCRKSEERRVFAPSRSPAPT
jgi:hypothetical protein